MLKRKGQITVEFIIVLIILFILFGFALFSYSERNAGFIYSKQSFEAKALANKIALVINKIYIAGNGAETTFLLDGGGYGFDVNFTGRSVEVSWGTNLVVAPLLTNRITAEAISPGKFVRIKNENQVIVIEQL